MAQQWQALADTVDSELAKACARHLEPYLRHANSLLGFRNFQMGLLNGEHVVPLESVDLVGPTANLRSALDEMARCNELSSRSVRVYSIYAGTLGVLTDAPLWQRYLAAGPQAAAGHPLWQTWAQRRADALHRTDDMSQWLRSVAAYDLATVDAFTVARSFPENSPSFRAWIRAAEKFAVLAKEEAHAASQFETIMSSAVTMQFAVGGFMLMH
ncbi:hypothetical protein ACQ4PT_041293 [Festuca glaucescens]